MKALIYIAAAVAMIVAYGLVGSADRAEAERQQSHYCDMVKLWAETGGNAGWPPYNGNCED